MEEAGKMGQVEVEVGLKEVEQVMMVEVMGRPRTLRHTGWSAKQELGKRRWPS
jgi:hypothetical protein